MTRIALVVIYLIGTVCGVVAMDIGDDGWLPVIWLLASVLLGAGTGEYRFAFLAFLAIPIAIPFGVPADTESDPVLPVWIGAMYLALVSSALVLLAAAVRRVVDSRRRRRLGMSSRP
ncbi:MAG TPA: hypothetical protein VGV34_07135 [Solirubrobacterales bacterium]|nr:hypothetical protein [Solirubrobacterales bacterium]